MIVNFVREFYASATARWFILRVCLFLSPHAMTKCSLPAAQFSLTWIDNLHRKRHKKSHSGNTGYCVETESNTRVNPIQKKAAILGATPAAGRRIFDELRRLSQRIGAEETTDSKGNVMTRIELVLRNWRTLRTAAEVFPACVQWDRSPSEANLPFSAPPKRCFLRIFVALWPCSVLKRGSLRHHRHAYPI